MKTGNSRKSFRAKEWRRLLIERDKKCQLCGTTKNLHAHHIIPWKENENLRFDLDNGRVYCKSCHYKIELPNRPPWNKGKKATIEVRKKMSEAKIGTSPWNKGQRTKPPTFRTCNICGIEKNILRFTPLRRFWRSNICKDCRNVALRKRGEKCISTIA